MVNFTINPESPQPSIFDHVYKAPVKLLHIRQYILYHSVLGFFESKQKEQLAKEEQLSQLRANLTSKKTCGNEKYVLCLPPN